MTENSRVREIRDRIKEELLGKPAVIRDSLDVKIYGSLQAHLESASHSISEEQRKAIINTFERREYKVTIEMILEACQNMGQNNSFHLRSLAGTIGVKYLGEFKVY